jgi:hypothetical protein
MPKGDETFHENGEWHNGIEGAGRVISTHSDKEIAVRAGREAAQERKVEHIIKNMDGTIGERNCYGNNPRDVPG